jgi:hypothetical protein
LVGHGWADERDERYFESVVCEVAELDKALKELRVWLVRRVEENRDSPFPRISGSASDGESPEVQGENPASGIRYGKGILFQNKVGGAI